MTLARLVCGLAVFLALSGAGVANLVLMQPQSAVRQQSMAPRPSNGLVRQDVPREKSVVAEIGSADTRQGVARELVNRGYLGSTEASASGTTITAAIMAFEYDQGLPLTGEASDAVLEALILGTGGSAGTALVPVTPAARNLTDSVERALRALGLRGSDATDLPSAIRAFERDAKLPETGRISAPLVDALTRAAQRRKVSISLRS